MGISQSWAVGEWGGPSLLQLREEGKGEGGKGEGGKRISNGQCDHEGVSILCLDPAFCTVVDERYGEVTLTVWSPATTTGVKEEIT